VINRVSRSLRSVALYSSWMPAAWIGKGIGPFGWVIDARESKRVHVPHNVEPLFSSADPVRLIKRVVPLEPAKLEAALLRQCLP